ncbi:hypothetical protein [Streptomyces sp. cmx-4-7]|uniref:hypothetical protein n=1 Tax=Streptomyces sp. cmx-4-7 TaxID=2790939 RepID=UPI00397F38A9
MHGTRTTAKILLGAAMAALTGCVSVDAPPVATAPAPAPAAELVRPGKDVAPQIADGPAREALEAALPAPPPSAAPRASGRDRRAAAPSLPEAPRPGVVPQQRERPRASARPAPSGPAASAAPYGR